jgi:hypothetical protein
MVVAFPYTQSERTRWLTLRVTVTVEPTSAWTAGVMGVNV